MRVRKHARAGTHALTTTHTHLVQAYRANITFALGAIVDRIEVGGSSMPNLSLEDERNRRVRARGDAYTWEREK